MIHLAVHGAAGRMGARLCSLARDDGRFQLVAQIDLESNAASPPRGATIDAVIDFSSDDGARGATSIAVKHGAALLVGSTGLSRQTLADIEVAARSIPVLVASNTSVGVAVLTHVAVAAARLLGPRFQVDILETHHVHKRDSPSGTALRLAEALRREAGADLPAERIHAVRAGDVVGEHTVEFSGPGERLRLAHLATSRDLFARGALEAAAWLAGRSPGRYTIEQSLGLVEAPTRGTSS